MTASTDAAPATAPDSLLEGAPPVDAGDEADPAKGTGVMGRFAPIVPYLPGRREAIFLAGGLLLGGAAGAGAGYLGVRPSPVAAPPQRDDEAEVTAKAAKERLEQGNARFVAGRPLFPDQAVSRRDTVAEAQHPFAAVLSCADSRVPPETLFDQGLGDLFVVRSLGQVVDHAVLGSLQYGVEHLGVSLLVVLGHSACGAVKATIEAAAGAKPNGTDVDALVAGMTPAVKEAKGLGAQDDELLDVSIQINVEHIVENLKQAAVIGEAASLRKIKVVGGLYDLATGEVEWL
jgi:carbonic anhydrase